MAVPHHGRQPQDFLEFHIKSTGPGSHHATHDLNPGDPVAVEAPLGEHYWRPVDKPVLLLAGGLGIAPVKAVTEAALARSTPHPLHLYWGVRDDSALYLEDHFKKLARQHAHFHFVPVLSDDGQDAGPYRTGTIGTALSEDFETLEGFAAWLAGPPAMVEHTLPVLLQKGMAREDLFSDAFRV